MWPKLGIVIAAAGLLALLAFFQARALATLLGGAIGLAPPVEQPVVSFVAPTTAARTGAAVLERNPFDSSWHPEQATPVAKGPLEAPRCASFGLAAVAESTDEAWSLASLVVSTTGKPKLVRRGDWVDDREVAYVGENPLLASPAVWLRTRDELCQVVLRERTPDKPRPPPSPELTPLENPKIRRVGPNEREVDRALFEELFARQQELAGHVRGVRTSDGRPGAQLVRVAPGSILAQAGFANGDVLLGVDGHDMSTPERALPVLIKLRGASQLGIDLERGGRRLTLAFRIR